MMLCESHPSFQTLDSAAPPRCEMVTIVSVQPRTALQKLKTHGPAWTASLLMRQLICGNIVWPLGTRLAIVSLYNCPDTLD